jgi:hypothetical protein
VAQRQEERETEKLQKHKGMLVAELKRPTTIEMPDWLTLLHAAYPSRNVTTVSEATSRFVTVEGIDVLVWSSITRVLHLISDEMGVGPDLESVKLQLGRMYLNRVGGV